MPQVSGVPKELNRLLESAYSSCMADKNNKALCSKISWGAARNAGWYKDKDGQWKKRKKKK